MIVELWDIRHQWVILACANEEVDQVTQSWGTIWSCGGKKCKPNDFLNPLIYNVVNLLLQQKLISTKSSCVTLL